MEKEAVTTASITFTGENWTTWKFQPIIMLKSKGLYEITMGISQKPVTDPNGEWDRKDARAQEIIAVRMDAKVLTHLLSCQTSAQMWEKLKSIYEHQLQVSVHLLQQRFFGLEYNQGNVAEFVSQLEEIKGNLKQLGEELSDKMVMTKKFNVTT